MEKKNNNLEFDCLAVLVQTKDGKVYQLYINKETHDKLAYDLQTKYSENECVYLIPNELKGIEINYKGF